MTTKIRLTGEATLSEMQAAINSFGEVEFAAGDTFTLTGYLSIRKPTKLFSDPTNPATIKRSPGNSRAIVLNASGIRIHNLICDFNTANGWQPYASFFNFNIPAGDSQTQNVVSGTRIIGVDFVDSEGSVPGSNDSWGIVFTNGAAAGIQDTKIIGCRMLASNRQLTAGGAGGGVNGCEIAFNFVRNGRSNAIAVSNKFNDGTEAEDENEILSNINIHHNVLIGGCCNGVFVGRDGNDDPDIKVSMANIRIADNYMQLRQTPTTFGKGILIKSGTSNLSTWTNVSILRNKIVNSKSTVLTVRLLDLQGPPTGPAEVTIEDNQFFGPSPRNISNLTVAESGNTLNGSPVTVGA